MGLDENNNVALDEDKILGVKIELLSKEKLSREYRILYYRNKEVRQLLQDYFNANADLVESNEKYNQQYLEIYNDQK